MSHPLSPRRRLTQPLLAVLPLALLLASGQPAQVRAAEPTAAQQACLASLERLASNAKRRDLDHYSSRFSKARQSCEAGDIEAAHQEMSRIQDALRRSRDRPSHGTGR